MKRRTSRLWRRPEKQYLHDGGADDDEDEVCKSYENSIIEVAQNPILARWVRGTVRQHQHRTFVIEFLRVGLPQARMSSPNCWIIPAYSSPKICTESSLAMLVSE